MTELNESLIGKINKIIGQPNVLLIDDSVKNLTAFRSQLRRDANVFLAGNRDEALLAVNSNNIDMVFIDYRMPINGADIMKEIVALYPKIKRCIMTAYPTKSMRIEFIEKSNTTDILQKPWSVLDVMKRVSGVQ